MPAEVGKPAPDFTLKDQDNNEVSLSSLKGKKTVVMFIPFPWTGICDSEACAVRDDKGFENEGAQTAVDTITSHLSDAGFGVLVGNIQRNESLLKKRIESCDPGGVEAILHSETGLWGLLRRVVRRARRLFLRNRG